MTHGRMTKSILIATEKWGALFTQFPTFTYPRVVNFLGEPTKLPIYAGPKLILLELSRQLITYHEKCLKRKKGGTPFPLTVGRYTCLSHHKEKVMFVELELLNLKHKFPARPTLDTRNCLPRAKLDPIHIPQIEDIYIDIYHEVDLRRKDYSPLALAEIIQYCVAIVPKGYQTTEQEVDQVYLDTGGDDWPFAMIDKNKSPLTIEERVKETLHRIEHWCRMNGLIYLGVDFTTSPLRNAPPRENKLLKGKGKGKEGESSTTQEEALESPPSTSQERVEIPESLEEEATEDVPIGTSTQDVTTTITDEVPSVPSPSPPSPPQVTQATIPLLVSSPPSSTIPPSSSSIFSSLAELSPTISSLISQLPSIPMYTSPAVSLPPVSTSLTSLSMPPPSVSMFFPSTTAATPFSISGPSPISPAWISQHLSQQKRKVPIALLEFSVIPSKGAKKKKPITSFSQSASGERVMEIAYPNPLKDKKDLSSTDYTVAQVTMGTSSKILQGEALSAVDALRKKLQEAKEEKRLLKE
ncbi:hypothetical protein KI387_043863 [Taxus chinensis]|uniref:Uncharacterized protein n=1 Tax=Taxus chinensis TaxID=29808 RepID=A0AA38CKZ5_TAXCH|nr:hypothetical protein KI387_043863 [Taxus chinensis]